MIGLPCPYYLDMNRRSRGDGWKLSIPSTSRTLAKKHGEPSTNLLAGLDAPLACALSRQTPSRHNSWRTEHTGLGIASLPGSSTTSCPTCGRFLHLRVIASLNFSYQRSLLLPSDAWSQESLRDCIPSSGVYTPRRVVNFQYVDKLRAISVSRDPNWPPRVDSKILVLRLPHFLHTPTQNSKDLE